MKSLRPTQSDIAREAGVSRGLVSRALSDSSGVSAETKERILSVAKKLGYVRNLTAASLAGGMTTALGVVLPGLQNPFFEHLVTQVNEQTENSQILPLIVTTQDDPRRESMLLQKLQEMRVAGCILVSPSAPLDDLLVVGSQFPLVVLGSEPIGGSVDVVRMDEHAAAALVMDRLRETHLSRVWNLSARGSVEDRGVKLRAESLHASAGDLRFEHITLRPGDSLQQLLVELRSRAAPARFGVITHNDLLGADVVTAARAVGLNPGADFSLISYDDTHLAARPEFALTSVRQNSPKLIEGALQMLNVRQSDLSLPAQNMLSRPSVAIRATG